MAQTQVIQGTWEELSAHAASLGNRLLTLVIPEEKETVNEMLLQRPKEIKTKERLETLLLEGLASPSWEMTATDWNELKQRSQDRKEE